MTEHLISDGVFNADDSDADKLLNHVVFVAPVWLTISLKAHLVTLTSRLICSVIKLTRCMQSSAIHIISIKCNLIST